MMMVIMMNILKMMVMRVISINYGDEDDGDDC
jgi:hypothetical protein